MKRIAVVILALTTLVVSHLFAGGTKENFPSKPLTITVPWSAGGGTDRTARFIAGQLSKVVGQRVNVVNKTGGGGAVGMQAGANAAPDGYTITNLTFEINTISYLGYSKLTPKDFIPLVQFNQDAAAVTVNAASPYKNINQLLEAIRSKPAGTFSFSDMLLSNNVCESKRYWKGACP